MATINSFISRAFIFVSLKFIVPSASKEPGNSGIDMYICNDQHYGYIMLPSKVGPSLSNSYTSNIYRGSSNSADSNSAVSL